jgi:hypothetical protein
MIRRFLFYRNLQFVSMLFDSLLAVSIRIRFLLFRICRILDDILRTSRLLSIQYYISSVRRKRYPNSNFGANKKPNIRIRFF